MLIYCISILFYVSQQLISNTVIDVIIFVVIDYISQYDLIVWLMYRIETTKNLLPKEGSGKENVRRYTKLLDRFYLNMIQKSSKKLLKLSSRGHRL